MAALTAKERTRRCRLRKAGVLPPALFRGRPPFVKPTGWKGFSLEQLEFLLEETKRHDKFATFVADLITLLAARKLEKRGVVE
jgi:hypothetical protein